MTKSVVLTVPEIQKDIGKTITPNFDALGLVDRCESLVYGFHGKSTSKAAYLAAAFSRVTSPADFYVINLKLFTPDDFDETLLLGQLHPEVLSKLPFLIAKRCTSALIAELGELWAGWAKEIYGASVVLKADVDWNDLSSFVPAFPRAAEKLFDKFPKLHCAVLPMLIFNEKGEKVIAWLGVIPKAKASKWIAEATVNMKDIKVNLNFKK